MTMTPILTAAQQRHHVNEVMRNKGKICALFLSQGKCEHEPNCPYMHISNGEERPIPDSVCRFYETNVCLREKCVFFHGPRQVLEQLKTSGRSSFRPQDVMPVEVPPRDIVQLSPLPPMQQHISINGAPPPGPMLPAAMYGRRSTQHNFPPAPTQSPFFVHAAPQFVLSPTSPHLQQGAFLAPQQQSIMALQHYESSDQTSGPQMQPYGQQSQPGVLVFHPQFQAPPTFAAPQHHQHVQAFPYPAGATFIQQGANFIVPAPVSSTPPIPPTPATGLYFIPQQQQFAGQQ